MRLKKSGCKDVWLLFDDSGNLITIPGDQLSRVGLMLLNAQRGTVKAPRSLGRWFPSAMTFPKGSLSQRGA